MRGSHERAPRAHWQALLLVSVSLLLCACPPKEHIARVSDAQVVAAGKLGGGISYAPKPIEGKPLVEAFGLTSRCTPAEDLLKLLGPACSHESENPVPITTSESVDDLEPGKHERTRQVRWYCDEDIDVRVVFDPCDGNGDGKTDGIVPVEIAVAIHRRK